MKNFIANNKRIIIITSVALSTIIALIFSALILLDVVKHNNIKRINAEIESVYYVFENTDDKTEKYNILTGFIADSENYSKYQENEKNYQNKISEMKNHFVVSYENLIKENSIDISDKTTKEELSTAISNLNEVKKTINSNKIIQIEDLISEIESKIQNYETKIAEIEAAEKVEEERLKKEAEEKARKEAEEAAKKVAENKTSNNSSNKNSKNSDSSNVENNNTKEKTESSNSGVPVFDPSKPHRYTFDVDENGNEIPGTRVYAQDFNNFDSNYNYLGNAIEDGWVVEIE